MMGMRGHVNDRFDASVTPEPNTGCWLWVGTIGRNGYGRIRRDGVRLWAHRFSYERFKGPIPSGTEICHTCDTPLCVNPDHLFAGTHTENMRDSVRKGRNNTAGIAHRWLPRTHCKHGHEYTAENSMPNGKGAKRCRACWKASRAVSRSFREDCESEVATAGVDLDSIESLEKARKERLDAIEADQRLVECYTGRIAELRALGR